MDAPVIEVATPKAAWGKETLIDLYECDAELIRDIKAVRRFVRRICKKINMKRFGNPKVVHFGEDERIAGFSFTQLLETSLLSGHLANATNTAFINIFSCGDYDEREAVKLCKKFFKAQDFTYRVVERFDKKQ